MSIVSSKWKPSAAHLNNVVYPYLTYNRKSLE